MPFREKSAWISFAVVLVGFGTYSVSISGDLSVSPNISHRVAALVALMAVVLAVAVVDIVAHNYRGLA
jgi:membrane protein YdbS with pleckstrin-like domain